ncbi:MAG: TPR end-of-group domain-containing protein [Planctomycetota bacterium]|jgi:tetratricopeptide (TPR) repeat protein
MVKQEHDEIELAGLRFQIGVFEQVLASRPADAEALRFLAHAYGAVGRAEDRLEADRKLCELGPRDPRAFYNLACSLTILGRLEEAMDTLQHAFQLGFRDGVLLRKDHELDPLRDDPRFVALAALLEDT